MGPSYRFNGYFYRQYYSFWDLWSQQHCDSVHTDFVMPDMSLIPVLIIFRIRRVDALTETWIIVSTCTKTQKTNLKKTDHTRPCCRPYKPSRCKFEGLDSLNFITKIYH